MSDPEMQFILPGDPTNRMVRPSPDIKVTYIDWSTVERRLVLAELRRLGWKIIGSEGRK